MASSSYRFLSFVFGYIFCVSPHDSMESAWDGYELDDVESDGDRQMKELVATLIALYDLSSSFTVDEDRELGHDGALDFLL